MAACLPAREAAGAPDNPHRVVPIEPSGGDPGRKAPPMPTNTEYHDPYDDGNEDPDDPTSEIVGRRQGRSPPHTRTEYGGLPIPYDVLQWYPAALYRWLTTELYDGDGGSGWIAKYQKWYQDRPSEFLVYERYGEGFSMWGGWRLNEFAMWGAVDRANADLGWTEPEEDKGPPEARAPVGPATETDVDAALGRIGTTRAPEEPTAVQLLDGEDFVRFYRHRDRIRRKTPRPCYCCGTMFVGTQVSAITCDACKAAGQRRCLDCDRVFKAPHGKVRRCESCLALSRAEAEAKAAQRAKRGGFDA